MPGPYSLFHLSDQVLLGDLRTVLIRDRGTTAEVLAHIAEVDFRKLYVPAGYPSMYSYCVQELHLSEEAAYKRIHAGRAARRFPAIFDAVAKGRLHLSAVVLLAPHLTPDTADELIEGASHKSKSEIALLLAQRFAKPDLPTRIEPLSPVPALQGQQPGLEAQPSTESISQTGQHAPGRVEMPAPPPRVKPLAPQRFAVQFTMDQEAHDLLRQAQALLGHQIPSGNVGQVFVRALRVLVHQLEKNKFAATDRPRPSKSPVAGRYVPAAVKRAVWKRDGARCTFVSDSGTRCSARSRLEFDHIDEVARGGRAAVERTRLRCRAHNQYAAECSFGRTFMANKRRRRPVGVP